MPISVLRPFSLLAVLGLSTLSLMGQATSSAISLLIPPILMPTSPADRAAAIEIFKQLIELNTTDTPLGNVTTATAAMQKRLLDAGFAENDVHLLGPDPRKQNLVVRIHGTGGSKPVLFLCHM